MARTPNDYSGPAYDLILTALASITMLKSLHVSNGKQEELDWEVITMAKPGSPPTAVERESASQECTEILGQCSELCSYHRGVSGDIHHIAEHKYG